jgi:hypothetical protein
MASRYVRYLRRKYKELFGKKEIGPIHKFENQIVWALSQSRDKIENLKNKPLQGFLTFTMKHAHMSKSQVFQDLFVLYVLGEKKGGFFCEFGATNGISLSNSYCLETNFGWSGICAEPARNWLEELRLNRPNAIIDNECVWSESGKQLDFLEAPTKELSTLQIFGANDSHSFLKRSFKTT